MIQELRKSINSILYERTTSPLYGTFIISWIIWNWKIVYLTIFISEDKITTNKIDYINNHYIEYWNLIGLPLISTLFLITIIPFISHWAYWCSLKFTFWKKNVKNEIEKSELLNVEQSQKIKMEIINKQKEFKEALNSKDSEIEQLKSIINNKDKSTERKELEKLAELIINNSNLYKIYNKLVVFIQNNKYLEKVNTEFSEITNILRSYALINIFTDTNLLKIGCEFTNKGKLFNEIMIETQNKKQNEKQNQ